MAYLLSVLIPARNEYYYDLDLLGQTIENVLANTSDRCEVVCVLDGSWSLNPLPSHPRLTVIHHSKSIGQRAATNEAARIATGEWVCKLDAHSAVDKDFDIKLIEGMEDDWTVVAGQYNLQAFQWKCKKCGWLKDQSPKPAKCAKCGSQYVKLVPLWFPRDGRENSDGVGGKRIAYTHNWRFDTDLCFQYWGEGAADEDYCKRRKIPFRPEMQGKVHDTMCLLGACWAIKRDRYFDLNICDEAFGSWGSQGFEVSVKSWLSGGRLVVNQNTWFAHFFRVGGINFPYPGGGQKQRAVARSKELFLQNKWPKQIYPLSWVIEKFKPVPDWHTIDNNKVLAEVEAAGASFSSVLALSSVVASSAKSNYSSSRRLSSATEKVSPDAAGFGTVDDGNSQRVSPHVVPVVSHQHDVRRVATRRIVTDDVIQDGNSASASSRQRCDQPSIHVPVGQFDVPAVPVGDMSVSIGVAGAKPNPAVALLSDSGENANQLFGVNVRNGKQARPHGLTITNRGLAGYLYYTCNTHDQILELAARNNLLRSKNGNELGCVSLKRTDFGDWNIVVPMERSPATMHYQILAGLERVKSDYVFLCESDVFYSPSHFEFVPLDDDTFWYNTNVWRIRFRDGHAVRTADCKQVSGICAARKLLLAHYRKRIAVIEANGGKFDVKKMAYEPGTRGKFGDEKIATWESPFPNLDITGHGNTLTTPHFSVDSFRNKKYAVGWKETDDALPGWPKLSDGGLQRLLEKLANGQKDFNYNRD